MEYVKNIIVEAIQWDGKNEHQIRLFTGDKFVGVTNDDRLGVVAIDKQGRTTLHRALWIDRGDYIVKLNKQNQHDKTAQYYETYQQKVFEQFYKEYKDCPHCGGDV